MAENSVVHQALHGYFDGHRLLRSSVELTKSWQNLMAVFSDISGSSSGVDFNDYLTGYPLGQRLYALAKTWRASETSRIGGVWTHTLLIDADDLQRARNLKPLLDLFRRPGSQEDPARYSEPLQLPQAIFTTRTSPAPEVKPSLAADLIMSLYSERAKPGTWVVTKKPGVIDQFIIALWTQQWPKLRSTFTFCTLSFANRTMNQKPFMLQIGPRIPFQGKAREVVNIVYEDSSTQTFLDNKWVMRILDDLAEGDHESPLRRFLRQFSEDLPADRSKVEGLVTTYEEVKWFWSQGDGPIVLGETLYTPFAEARDAVEVVARCFPVPSEARILKGELFGDKAMIRSMEAPVLKALLSSSRSGAFDSTSLSIRRRVTELALQNPDFTIEIAQAVTWSELESMNEAFLLGMLDGLSEPDAHSLRSKAKSFLVGLVKEYPSVGTLAEIWRLPIFEQEEIWKAILQGKPRKETVRSIVDSMIDVGSDWAADTFGESYGHEAVSATMAWLEAHSEKAARLPRGWKGLLKRGSNDLVAWLNEHKQLKVTTWEIVGEVLQPSLPQVAEIGLDRWIAVAADAVKVTPQPVELLAFLLSLGFDTPNRYGLRLAELTFDPIHEAGLKDLLHGRPWSLLERRVPWGWREWDRCQRLREALVERFIRYEWPPLAILRIAKHKEVLEPILKFSAATSDGRSFLGSLKSQIQNEGIHLEDWQSRILSAYPRQ